jgi:hypothetical protein
MRKHTFNPAMLALVHNGLLRHGARIWGKKRKCLLCSVMAFLMCRSFTLYRKDMVVMMDTMELFNKAKDTIAHTIDSKIYSQECLDQDFTSFLIS